MDTVPVSNRLKGSFACAPNAAHANGHGERHHAGKQLAAPRAAEAPDERGRPCHNGQHQQDRKQGIARLGKRRQACLVVALHEPMEIHHAAGRLVLVARRRGHLSRNAPRKPGDARFAFGHLDDERSRFRQLVERSFADGGARCRVFDAQHKRA